MAPAPTNLRDVSQSVQQPSRRILRIPNALRNIQLPFRRALSRLHDIVAHGVPTDPNKWYKDNLVKIEKKTLPLAYKEGMRLLIEKKNISPVELMANPSSYFPKEGDLIILQKLEGTLLNKVRAPHPLTDFEWWALSRVVSIHKTSERKRWLNTVRDHGLKALNDVGVDLKNSRATIISRYKDQKIPQTHHHENRKQEKLIIKKLNTLEELNETLRRGAPLALVKLD